MSTRLYKKLTQMQGKSLEDPYQAFQEIQWCYHNVIQPYLDPSPIRRSVWLSEYVGGEVWLKLESLNPNGSFKVRGALNALFHLKHEHNDPAAGPLRVCAASAGNHAQGVAYAAKQLGYEAHIFLPHTAPLVKREATARLGAKVYLVGENLEEASEAAIAFAEKENAYFLHAYNDANIIIGQATCAYEILLQHQRPRVYERHDMVWTLHPEEASQYKHPDYLICSVGGGGLAAGCALVCAAMGGRTRLIGVEQEYFDSAQKSLYEKKQIPAKAPKTTIADGIAVGLVGNLTYQVLSQHLEKMTTVSDDMIVRAVLALCEKEHIVAEGAGAAAVAELLKNPSYYAGKTVIACVSGGNIDPQLLCRVLARGLRMTDRVLRMTVCVRDRPGGLQALLQCIANLGANVLDLVHDRTYSAVSVGDVDVEVSLEIKDSEHQYVLLKGLEEAGFQPRTHE